LEYRLIARWHRFPWREGGGRLLLVLCASPLVSTAVVFHATSLLAASGVGRGGTAGALSLMAVCGALGGLLGGVLMDRAGVRSTLIAMNLLLTASLVLLLLPSAGVALGAFALLGLGQG